MGGRRRKRKKKRRVEGKCLFYRIGARIKTPPIVHKLLGRSWEEWNFKANGSFVVNVR
jgi:hypothetical protein